MPRWRLLRQIANQRDSLHVKFPRIGFDCGHAFFCICQRIGRPLNESSGKGACRDCRHEACDRMRAKGFCGDSLMELIAPSCLSQRRASESIDTKWCSRISVNRRVYVASPDSDHARCRATLMLGCCVRSHDSGNRICICSDSPFSSWRSSPWCA